MKVSQDQGWAPRVELGLLGKSWASRVGQACGGLLGRGGAGREAVELSSSEQCWSLREQQIRSRARGEGVPGGQRLCASSQPGPGAESGSGWGGGDSVGRGQPLRKPPGSSAARAGCCCRESCWQEPPPGASRGSCPAWWRAFWKLQEVSGSLMLPGRLCQDVSITGICQPQRSDDWRHE